MASRRNSTANADDNGVRLLEDARDVDFDDVTDEADEMEKLENSIRSELGSSKDVRIKIKVHRKPATGSLYPLLFEVAGENVEEIIARVRDQYGTGVYEARVWKDFGDGKGFKQRERIPFSIELPKNPPAPAIDHGGSALIHAVTQQGEVLQALVAKLLTQPPPAPPPAQNFAEMFAGMATMAEAMRKFMGPPPAAAAPVNPLEMLSSVVALVKDANNEGREKGIMDLVGDFLNSDVMKTVVQNFTPQPAQPVAQPQRALVAPVPGTAQQPQPPAANAPPVDPVAAAQEKAFREFLGTLVLRAKKNSDPGLWADVIADTIEPAMLDQLLSLPDPVAFLTQYNQEIATYRDWFASVITLLTADDEGETTGGAPTVPAKAADAVGQPAPAASPASPA